MWFLNYSLGGERGSITFDEIENAHGLILAHALPVKINKPPLFLIIYQYNNKITQPKVTQLTPTLLSIVSLPK